MGEKLPLRGAWKALVAGVDECPASTPRADSSADWEAKLPSAGPRTGVKEVGESREEEGPRSERTGVARAGRTVTAWGE